MPIYRYECCQCGATFKLLQRNGDRPEIVCPECGATDAQRLLPRVGVVYRGSGYYSTDYRGKGSKVGTGESASRADAGKPSTGSGEAEAKPAKSKASKSASSDSGT
jgi:putative FmdB family regulatory protein